MRKKKNTRSKKNKTPGSVNGSSLNDSCNQLFRENSKSVHGFFIRAQLKYNEGDIQGAVLDLDEYLSKFPANVKALIFRAVILYDLCEYQGAIKDLSDVVLIHPDLLDVYIIRGDVYRSSGRLEESVDDFNRVIQSSPFEAMAYIGRGDTRMLQHETAGAKSDYDRAIAINPSLFTLCPEIETESKIVSITSPFDSAQGPGLDSNQRSDFGSAQKQGVDIHHSFFETSKITLNRRLRKLKRFYHRFKVLIDSSLNFVILCLVLPVNEFLTDSILVALIET